MIAKHGGRNIIHIHLKEMTVALSSSKTETVYWSLKIVTDNSDSSNGISK